MNTNNWTALINALAAALNSPAGLMITRSLARGILALLLAFSTALLMVADRWNGELHASSLPSAGQSRSAGVIVPAIE